MSTTQLAERYGCVSMTLEMPFKDNFDLPDPLYGWTPERSKYLAFACLDALHAILPDLEGATASARQAREGRSLMPTLVLLRHGQSQWNLENRFTGWWDVDLSRPGRDEARAAGSCCGARLRLRPLLHQRPDPRHPHAPPRPARDRPAVAAGRQGLAPQRAPLRRADRAQQAGDDRQGRRRAGQDLAPLLRHPAAAASVGQRIRCAARDRRYAGDRRCRTPKA